MPARKTKGTAAADTGTKVRAEKVAAADRAAAALVGEAVVGQRADIAGQVQVAAVLLHGVANAMGGMAQELANDGGDRAAGARPAVQGPSDKTPAATRRAPKAATRVAAKRAPRKSSAPDK